MAARGRGSRRRPAVTRARLRPTTRCSALISSFANRPPEVFLMANKPGAAATRVTTSPSAEWQSFKWVEPQLVTYTARDGKQVYARLYTPEMVGAKRDPKAPAVIFVHGAGYLQNAHKYWSSYSREYMFHHLLASRGLRRARSRLPRQRRVRPRLAHRDLPLDGRPRSERRRRRRRLPRRRRRRSTRSASASTAAATAASSR